MADGIERETRRELEALEIEAGRPLLAVDADEVLVDFAGHLGEFAGGLGLELRLERYDLEGAFRDRETGRRLGFDEAIGVIDRFFAEETVRQRAIAGAAEALARLSGQAQIIVLTNVPRHARGARAENLSGLGMPFPVVANTGGKGRALAWLAERAGAPVAFVDDSPSQIASAKRRAPGVLRLHFVGSDYVARVIPTSPDADHRVACWVEAERLVAAHLV